MLEGIPTEWSIQMDAPKVNDNPYNFRIFSVFGAMR
jgi:hypothetical protein